MKKLPFLFILVFMLVVLVATTSLFGLEKQTKLPPCCQDQDSAKKKSDSSKDLEIYQKLLITKAFIENGKVMVMGETDLPAGGKLKVLVTNGGDNAEQAIIKEKTVEISNARFTATLSVSSFPETQNLIAEVWFDPKVQPAGISKKVPTSGENLVGTAVESTDGGKIMKVTQPVVAK